MLALICDEASDKCDEASPDESKFDLKQLSQVLFFIIRWGNVDKLPTIFKNAETRITIYKIENIPTNLIFTSNLI